MTMGKINLILMQKLNEFQNFFYSFSLEVRTALFSHNTLNKKKLNQIA